MSRTRRIGPRTKGQPEALAELFIEWDNDQEVQLPNYTYDELENVTEQTIHDLQNDASPPRDLIAENNKLISQLTQLRDENEQLAISKQNLTTSNALFLVIIIFMIILMINQCRTKQKKERQLAIKASRHVVNSASNSEESII